MKIEMPIPNLFILRTSPTELREIAEELEKWRGDSKQGECQVQRQITHYRKNPLNNYYMNFLWTYTDETEEVKD